MSPKARLSWVTADGQAFVGELPKDDDQLHGNLVGLDVDSRPGALAWLNESVLAIATADSVTLWADRLEASRPKAGEHPHLPIRGVTCLVGFEGFTAIGHQEGLVAWNGATRNELAGGATVSDAALAQASGALAVVTQDGGIAVLDFAQWGSTNVGAGGTKFKRIADSLSAVAWAPDGSQLAVVDKEGRLLVCDELATLEFRHVSVPGPTLAIAFTSGGAWLAARLPGGLALVSPSTTSTLPWPPPPRSSPSPDGREVLLRSVDDETGWGGASRRAHARIVATPSRSLVTPIQGREELWVIDTSSLEPGREREASGDVTRKSSRPKARKAEQRRKSTSREVKKETSKPAATPALWLTLRGHDVALALGDTEFRWRLTVDWGAEIFQRDGKPNDQTLADVRKRLALLDLGDVQALGDKLGEILFAGAPAEAQVMFAVPVEETRRLVLDLEGESASVPWEYLRVDGDFLLERRLSIVRHVETAGAPRGKPVALGQAPSPVVFASANPNAPGAERFGAEHSDAITRAIGENMLISPCIDCSVSSLRERLQKADVAGFHFLGHGTAAGVEPALVVMPSPGIERRADYEPLTGRQLAQLFGDGVRFVFLGACHSAGVPADPRLYGVAAGIVRARGVPVVAMQGEVPEQYSTELAAQFYGVLDDVGFDLERAVHKARHIQPSNGRPAFGIPVLFADWREQGAAPQNLEGWQKAALHQALSLAVEHRVTLEAVSPGDLRGKLTDAGASRRVADEVSALAEAAGVREIPIAQGALRETLADVLAAIRPHAPRAELYAQAERLEAPASPREPERIRVPDSGVIERIENGASLEQICVDALDPSSPHHQALRDIEARYAFPEGLVARTLAELASGRHVLLVGPPGTGKTTLAEKIVEAIGYRAHKVTAASEWTSFEVIGGFFPGPAKNGGGAELHFRHGAFLEALLPNWEQLGSVWTRREGTPRGTWLLIDELNRADIDRALGPLFTALDRSSVRVAMGRGGEEATSVELPIPRDFRILATLNGVDRHFLFRLSDALKRRFAFIEVPVPRDLGDEWQKITGGLGVAGDTPVLDDLRRFVYLARLFHPIGPAQLRAAARFVHTAGRFALDASTQLAQAIVGSVLPGLEDLPAPVYDALLAWTQGDAEAIAYALTEERGGARVPIEEARFIDALRDEIPAAWVPRDGVLADDDAPRPAPEVLELAGRLAPRGDVAADLRRRLKELRREVG